MEQSVLALLQNHVLTPTSNFETFHCFETREKNIKFLSGCLGYQEFWFHNSIFLGVQKYWIPSCIVWEIRNSECSSVFLGDQKFWILSCVIWGIRNSESPVLFWGSEILNPLLCYWGIRNSESSPVLFWGIRSSKSSPVLFGG